MLNEDSSSSINNGKKNRINNLPDAILGDILSHFPTKEAFCTSVLSKQWRYVWTSVPFIEINDRFLLSKDDITNKYRNPEVKRSFIDFVDRVLRLNNVSPLQKCELICNQQYDERRFVELIRFMSSRDIYELCLQKQALSGPKSDSVRNFELPPCIFTCKKLVILKVNNQFVLNVPISVCLPSLKILHLARVLLFDDDSVENLIAGCPAIEELKYVRDYFKKRKRLRIHSSSLKRLRLDIAEFFDLDAKNLEGLDIRDAVREGQRYDVNSLSSLVSVQLDLYCKDLEATDVCIEFLSKICCTKRLKLSFLTMESLKSATFENLPMFHSLTHLVVEFVDSCWHVLPYLLESSPNLITFDFIINEDGLNDEMRFRSPKCLMVHLESVNIRQFDWSQNEMEMLRYFLKNSMVLNKLLIYADDEDSTLYKELCMLPKSSAACEIEILSSNCSMAEDFPLHSRVRDSDAW